MATALEKAKKGEATCYTCTAQLGVDAPLCAQCQAFFYCGKACQKAHWKAGHKHACGEAAPPYRLPSCNIQPSKNKLYRRRPAVESLLSGVVSAPGDDVTCAVLVGEAGVGKTWLANYYAYNNPEEFKYVIWLDASSRVGITRSIAHMTSPLDFQFHLAAPYAQRLSKLDVEAQVVALAGVFAQNPSLQPFLWVMDDARSVDIVENHAPARGGRVIVTTRVKHGWRNTATVIEVPKFDNDEAVAALRAGAGSDAPDAALNSLAETLEYHPTAISQAAAYMASQSIDPSEYARVLEEARATVTSEFELLERELVERAGIEDEAKVVSAEIAETELVSWRAHPESDPNYVPEKKAVVYEQRKKPTLFGYVKDEFTDVDNAILSGETEAAATAIVGEIRNPNSTAPLFAIPEPYDEIPLPDPVDVVSATARLLAEKVMADSNDWAWKCVSVTALLGSEGVRFEFFLESAIAHRGERNAEVFNMVSATLATLVKGHVLFEITPGTYAMSHLVRSSVLATLRPEEKTALATEIFHILAVHALFKVTDKNTYMGTTRWLTHIEAVVRNVGVGWLDGAAFNLELIAGAGECALKLLKDYVSAQFLLESGDLLTARCGSSTGSFLAVMGTLATMQSRPDDAVEYLERAVARELERGVIDMSSYTAVQHLGCVHGTAGHPGRAIEFMTKAYEFCLAVNGEESAGTAISIACLANAYAEGMGDYERAIELHQKCLAIHTAVTGAKSVEAALDYTNLGGCYKALGQLDEAVRYYKIALKLRKARLKVHPLVAATYSSLGELYELRGDYAEAMQCHHEALGIVQQALGGSHPKTLKFSEKVKELKALREADKIEDSPAEPAGSGGDGGEVGADD